MNTIDISIISNRVPITLSAEDILYITLNDRKASSTSPGIRSMKPIPPLPNWHKR